MFTAVLQLPLNGVYTCFKVTSNSKNKVSQKARNIFGAGKDVSHYLQFTANNCYGVYLVDKFPH